MKTCNISVENRSSDQLSTETRDDKRYSSIIRIFTFPGRRWGDQPARSGSACFPSTGPPFARGDHSQNTPPKAPPDGERAQRNRSIDLLIGTGACLSRVVDHPNGLHYLCALLERQDISYDRHTNTYPTYAQNTWVTKCMESTAVPK